MALIYKDYLQKLLALSIIRVLLFLLIHNQNLKGIHLCLKANLSKKKIVKSRLLGQSKSHFVSHIKEIYIKTCLLPKGGFGGGSVGCWIKGLVKERQYKRKKWKRGGWNIRLI